VQFLIEQVDECVLASGKIDTGLHLVQQAKRVIPLASFVKGGVQEQSVVSVERVHPLAGKAFELGVATCGVALAGRTPTLRGDNLVRWTPSQPGMAPRQVWRSVS